LRLTLGVFEFVCREEILSFAAGPLRATIGLAVKG